MTAHTQTTACAATCGVSATMTRSTWSWSGAAPAAPLLSSGSPGPAGGSWRWTPGRSGIRTATGSATRPAPTICTGPNPASSPAPTRCRSARTTPAVASAARWCTTPATRRAVTPATARRIRVTASAPTGRWRTRISSPTTRRSRGSSRSPARTGRGATRTPIRTVRTPWAATARSSSAVPSNSASRRFPDGLCNDFDQVGRYLMVQGAPQTAGRFDAEIRMYKAPPPEVSTEEIYEADPAKPYRRGFSVQTVSPLPITWAEHVAAQGHWGANLREYMSDYVHWATLGALCEFLPRPGNRVTLAEETDRNGMPVARFSYSQCDIDRLLVDAARKVMEVILRAAGADEVITIKRYAHLVGGARMAADERHGVVDRNCRTFAVPNLYITDGSVLPTQGSATPALTIMSVA